MNDVIRTSNVRALLVEVIGKFEFHHKPMCADGSNCWNCDWTRRAVAALKVTDNETSEGYSQAHADQMRAALLQLMPWAAINSTPEKIITQALLPRRVVRRKPENDHER